MTTPTRAGMAPPLPRAWLDTIAPALRVLFGIIFIAWSWISTLLVLGTLLAPVLPSSTLGGIPDRALIALGFAFLVSLAEFASSDRWPVAYWIVMLVCDASFTTWQTRAWLVQIVRAQTHIELLGHIAIWLVAIIGGIIAAKFGEVLLFGSRYER
jgi:hypothetical protein